MLYGFEHRIDYINVHQGGDTIEKVQEGSHVFITSSGNFKQFLCRTNRDANKTFGKLADFRRSRQEL